MPCHYRNEILKIYRFAVFDPFFKDVVHTLHTYRHILRSPLALRPDVHMYILSIVHWIFDSKFKVCAVWPLKNLWSKKLEVLFQKSVSPVPPKSSLIKSIAEGLQEFCSTLCTKALRCITWVYSFFPSSMVNYPSRKMSYSVGIIDTKRTREINEIYILYTKIKLVRGCSAAYNRQWRRWNEWT